MELVPSTTVYTRRTHLPTYLYTHLTRFWEGITRLSLSPCDRYFPWTLTRGHVVTQPLFGLEVLVETKFDQDSREKWTDLNKGLENLPLLLGTSSMDHLINTPSSICYRDFNKTFDTSRHKNERHPLSSHDSPPLRVIPLTVSSGPGI